MIQAIKHISKFVSIGLKLALLTLITFSCKEEALVEQITPEADPVYTSIWVSIINQTSSPVSLRFQVGIGDTIQDQHLTYKPFDTLEIEVNQERFLTIESKLSLGKKLIVIPGDSLFIRLGEEGINIDGTNLEYVDPGKSQLQTSTSSEQDSLYALLVQIDSAKSMKGSNDYSIYKSFPIFFQEDFYKEHPEAMEDFVSLAFSEAQSVISPLGIEIRKAPYTLGVKEELQLNRNFGRLSFLARRSQNELLRSSLASSLYFDQEFLLKSKHSFHYLRYYIEEVILKGEKDSSSNKRYIDYKKAYDLLGQHFDEPLLAKAKMLCLRRMIENTERYESIAAYATDYQNTYPEDTLFLEGFQNNFLLNQRSLVDSSVGLNLLNEDGATKMLTGLLKALKGKVVYVDYWASWCAPCRSAMPNSLQLKNKLKDKEVAFVYFSIDSGQEAWKKASLADGLEGYVHNYLVLNHVKSQMKKDLGIDAIPRYLIFDKKGKLVENSAPGPRDENLAVVLNKYIAN